VFTQRHEIRVKPGQMPRAVELLQQMFKASGKSPRIYASLTGTFNTVAFEVDYEDLADWASQASWPHPPQDPSPEEKAGWDEYFAIEVHGGEGAIWFRIA